MYELVVDVLSLCAAIIAIAQASAYTASHHVVQGILLTFHQLLLNSNELNLPLSLSKQVMLIVNTLFI